MRGNVDLLGYSDCGGRELWAGHGSNCKKCAVGAFFDSVRVSMIWRRI